jgi:hypothetical protein
MAKGYFYLADFLVEREVKWRKKEAEIGQNVPEVPTCRHERPSQFFHVYEFWSSFQLSSSFRLKSFSSPGILFFIDASIREGRFCKITFCRTQDND